MSGLSWWEKFEKNLQIKEESPSSHSDLSAAGVFGEDAFSCAVLLSGFWEILNLTTLFPMLSIRQRFSWVSIIGQPHLHVTSKLEFGEIWPLSPGMHSAQVSACGYVVWKMGCWECPVLRIVGLVVQIYSSFELTVGTRPHIFNLNVDAEYSDY